MKTIFFLSILLLPFYSYSQSDTIIAPESGPDRYTQFDLIQLQQLTTISAGARSFDTRYEGVKGTPFWQDDFKEATVVFSDQKGDLKKSKVKININLEEQILLVQVPNSRQIASLPCTDIQMITFEDQSQPIGVFSEKGMAWKGEGCAFGSYLHQGTINLVKVRNKVFRKANYKQAYSLDVRYDEYILYESYWMNADGGPYQKVKLNKKALQKAAPAWSDQMADILKKEKFDVKTESEAIQLLQLLEKAAAKE